jgi:DNA-binding XRE family transcriptional regulator
MNAPQYESSSQLYDLKALQAEAMAAVERDLAEAKRANDALHNARAYFLLLLVEARLHKGLSQTELAKRVGLRQPAMARIESGRGNPGLRTLLAIAKALDVTLMLE